MRARWPVVFFDLDGTLLRGTSGSVLTAGWLGRGGGVDEVAVGEEVGGGGGLGASAAGVVGDSRSDVAGFRCAGFSLALNADDAARAAATVTLDADDLRAVLPLLVA